jgi:hypothetical protein
MRHTYTPGCSALPSGPPPRVGLTAGGQLPLLLHGGGIRRGWDRRFFPLSQPSPARGEGDLKSPDLSQSARVGRVRIGVKVRRLCMGIALLWWLVPTMYSLAGEAGPVPQRSAQPQDACQPLVRQSATQLRQLLDFRLMWGFPAMAQLDEGNARLSPLSILVVDCEQQRVVVSGTYEFRGNLGVMDITRRGTTVLRFRVSPKPGQRQVWLEAPEVLEVTFDNPAPWFDGQAIRNWALALFATPLCANLQNGQPC